MEREQAVAQIDAIWAHLARAERFRGYRPAAVAATGICGFAASAIQSIVVPNPQADLNGYLWLWIGTACFCIVFVGLNLVSSCLQSGSRLKTQLTQQAVQQFAPCVIAGAAMTWIIADHHPEKLNLLPGFWAICFSLGIFASLPYMTPQILWVASYYLVAGACLLVWSRHEMALSAWMMAGSFGVGQLLMAYILYVDEGRSRGKIERE